MRFIYDEITFLCNSTNCLQTVIDVHCVCLFLLLITIHILANCFKEAVECKTKPFFWELRVVFSYEFDKDAELHIVLADWTFFDVFYSKCLWEIIVDNVGNEI